MHCQYFWIFLHFLWLSEGFVTFLWLRILGFCNFITVHTVTFLFCKFQTKLKMPRSSLSWVSMHFPDLLLFFCSLLKYWPLTLSHPLTCSFAYLLKWFFQLCFRWAWFWKGHSVWENSCKVWLHPSVIRGSAPCWSGLWLREGQAAPGHHAEGRACSPGTTLWTEKIFTISLTIHNWCV